MSSTCRRAHQPCLHHVRGCVRPHDFRLYAFMQVALGSIAMRSVYNLRFIKVQSMFTSSRGDLAAGPTRIGMIMPRCAAAKATVTRDRA